MPRGTRRTPIDHTRTIQGRKLERIFDALPAPTHAVIADRADLPVTDIGSCLSYLRKHCVEFGWTVPHAKRGNPTGEDKFFVVLVDSSDGTLETDSITVENTVYLHEGCTSTVGMVAQLGKNETKAILAYCAFLPPTSAIRGELEEIVVDINYLAHRAGRLLPQLEVMTRNARRSNTI